MNDPVAKKSLGQHWLHDEQTLQTIADAAGINNGETVLEIGPGAGTLTRKLVERAGEVIAVELDETLAAELPGRVRDTNLTVVCQDILKFDLTTLPPGYKVVANIPYYLTSHLIRLLGESKNSPQKAVLLIQKEVAERVAARPGSMSMLSVSAQFYWEVSLGPVVLAELFTPPPKVDSQVLVLTARPTPLFPDVDTKGFFRVVKAGFSNRRKTLSNSLAGGLHLSKQDISVKLAVAGVNPQCRPQELNLADWYKIYLEFRDI